MAENATVFTEDFTGDDHLYTTTVENHVQVLVRSYLTYKIGKLLYKNSLRVVMFT